MGGGWLAAGQLIGDERPDVVTGQLVGEHGLIVLAAVRGEESHGVGVRLDGSRALVLLLQRAPEADVERVQVRSGKAWPGATAWGEASGMSLTGSG
jgi:hypothetical protein